MTRQFDARDARRSLRARFASYAFRATLAALGVGALTMFVARATFGQISNAVNSALQNGKTQYANGDYSSAITTLETFLRQNPTASQQDVNVANLYLGCSYFMLHDGANASENDAARSYFARILNQGASAPNYKDALFHNARTYFGQRDYAKAKPLLLQFLDAYPNDVDFLPFVYYYLGVCEKEVGTFQAATQYFDDFLAKYGATDSALKWYCYLEKATLFGKQGQYRQADTQLVQLCQMPGVPSDVVGKATIQRALLFLAQDLNDQAIAALEDYAKRYISDPAAAPTIQEAYLYEAYAYFAKGDSVSALAVIDALQRMLPSLPPEAVTLKIKLLLSQKNVNEAERLLNILRNSELGQTTPDVITSYESMINLARGDRDAVIKSLNAMLVPTQNPGTNVVRFDYYNSTTPKNFLAPLDFVEACGILTLAYAGRYANDPNRKPTPTNNPDYNAQEALYQATAQYVSTLRDPAISRVLAAIDEGRKNILSRQNPSAQEQLAILAPGYNSVASNAISGGGFSNPTDPSQFQNPGFRPQDGQYSGSNIAGYGGNGQGAPANQAQSPGGLTLPNLPSNNGTNAGQTNQTGQNQVAQNPAGQNQVAQYPAGQNQVAQNPAGQNQVAQYPAGQNQVAQNPAGQNQVAQNPAGQNQVAQNPTVGAEATTPQEPTRLTPEEARAALQRATNYFKNLEFKRANEILLEARLKSETFWQDCPEEAAKISILRANALFELDMRTEAEITCNEIVEHAPSTPEAALANFYLGRLADSLGRQDEAVRRLRQATYGRNDFPYADVALYYLGTNEIERGNVNGASATFERLLRDYPQSAYWSHAALRLAKIEFDRGNDEIAEKIVNEALANRPDLAVVDYLLMLKGNIALRAKDYYRAVVAFNMIIDEYPDSKWLFLAKNRLSRIPEYFRVKYASADASPNYGAASLESDFANDLTDPRTVEPRSSAAPRAAAPTSPQNRPAAPQNSALNSRSPNESAPAPSASPTEATTRRPSAEQRPRLPLGNVDDLPEDDELDLAPPPRIGSTSRQPATSSVAPSARSTRPN